MRQPFNAENKHHMKLYRWAEKTENEAFYAAKTGDEFVLKIKNAIQRLREKYNSKKTTHSISSEIPTTTPLTIKDNSPSTSAGSKSDTFGSKKQDQRSRSRSRHDLKKSSKHERKWSPDKRSRSRARNGHDKCVGGRDDKERYLDRKNRSKDREWDTSRSKVKQKEEAHDYGVDEKSRRDHSHPKAQAKAKPIPPRKKENYNHVLVHKNLEVQLKPTTLVETTIATKPDTQLKTTVASGLHKIYPCQTPLDTIMWNGNVTMLDVATFRITASPISGDCRYIGLEFPSKLEIIGRIIPDIVWDYINKIKLSKEIVIVRFAPHSDVDESAYVKLLNFLESQARLGVIKSTSAAIKDFYILPLASQKSLPAVLLPITGEGFESNCPDLLLGIIVKHKNVAGLKRPQQIMTKPPVQAKVIQHSHF